MLVIEISPGEIDVNCLTDCQTDARNGLYATVLASYLQWLASRLDAARKQLPRSVEEWRHEYFAHHRAPDLLGQLAAGFDLFLNFAVDKGALSNTQVDEYRRRARTALLEIGNDQSRYQTSDDPVTRFLHLLAGAFASGEAHVADARTGREPEGGDGEKWGWGCRVTGTGQSEDEEWFFKGQQIGWIEDDDIFLEPEATFACVQQFATRQGTSLSIGQTTLWKRLDERGLLTSRDKDHCTTRKTTAAGRKRVIHLRADVLSRESGPIGPTGPNPAKADGERTTAQDDCEPWPNNRPTSGPTAPTNGHERSDGAASSPVGPLPRGEKQPDGENGHDVEEGWV
jgi:hypothetical protein